MIFRLFTPALLIASGFGAGALWAQSQSVVAKAFEAIVAAYNAKDLDRLSAAYSESAVMMGANEPMAKGRQAIRQSYESAIKSGAGAYEGRVIESAVSGDLGYVVFTGTSDMKGTKVTGHGIAVFRRINGEWKAVADASMPDTDPRTKK